MDQRALGVCDPNDRPTIIFEIIVAEKLGVAICWLYAKVTSKDHSVELTAQFS
jgi:hypothetical protein